MTQPVLEVIEHPLSPYAQKVKIALMEKGLTFTTSIPSAIGSGSTPADFMAASPRGEVPVLIVDGKSLFDSTIILEFIEDRFPDPPLLPSDPFERARARSIEEVCDTTYEAITWALSELKNFRRAEGELGEAMQARAADDLAALHRWLEGQLAGKPYLNGDSFGWADLSAAPFVAGALGFGVGPTAGPLADWFARVAARPSVSASLEAARNAAAAMAGVAQIVESGLFKRQYRDHRLEFMVRSGGIEVIQKGLARDNIRFNSPRGMA